MKLLQAIAIFLFFTISYGQSGILKGTTLDQLTGKPLPGVTIRIENTGFSAISDLDGNFTFTKLPAGQYDLNCTFISYQAKNVTGIVVTATEEATVTIGLVESASQLNEVVLAANSKAKTESVKSLLLQQKNSPSVSDGISAETIKRTPDKNTSDVLKRISGASIQDNKFVVVRGLNDRYNANFLNGAPLPSSEPDRKAFSFDIFPSNMLDNLVISKTATPDQTGDFAGGIIQINTKNIPGKNFQTLSVGGGYNTITTGKKQVYYKGGNTDWLGLDDGTRSLSSKIPDYFTFRDLNSLERADYAKYVNSDWSLHEKNFSPNVNFQYAIGQRIPIREKTLGVLFSVSYNKTNNYFETARKDYEDQGPGVRSLLSQDFSDKNYLEQYLLGALANFSLQLNPNNTLSFKNIYSINSEDKVVERSGAPFQATDPNPLKIASSVRWFTSNKIYSGQFIGEHYLPQSKFRINWQLAYSRVDRSIPNLRRNIYTYYDQYQDPLNPNPLDLVPTASIADGNGGADYGGGMFFSENKENSYNAKFDLMHKIGKTDELKFGIYVHNRDRSFFARQLQYNKLNLNAVFDDSLLNLPNETIFNPEHIGIISPGVGGFTLFDGSKYFDAYTANSKLIAGYMMMDNRVGKFRLVWGARFEDYTQKLHTKESDTKDLEVNNNVPDLLPSANLIYSVNEKQNIRLGYSKTLNRPEFRELAPFGFYDFTTQFFTSGNPKLDVSHIQNADFRYEVYPGRSQLFSVSAFYKKFKRPIELVAGVNNKEVSYKNAESAENYGFEMEFRTLAGSLLGNANSGFLNDLTVFSNLSLITSKVNVSNLASATDSQKQRPMQGQSPYVFNAGIQYLNTLSGWTLSANLNRIGNRIAVVGNSEAEPTLWEKGRTLLDGQVSKVFLKKKFEIKLNLQNILDQDLIFYQNKDLDQDKITGIKGFANNIFTGNSQNRNGYDRKSDDLIWSSRFGRTFSLTMSYNF